MQSGKQRIQLWCEGPDVRRRCLMLTLLLDLTIDWVMRQTTLDRPQGIRWTLFSTLQDLNFPTCSVGLTHSPAHARENHPSQHVYRTSRPEDQPDEDKSDDAECLKPLSGHSGSGYIWFEVRKYWTSRWIVHALLINTRQNWVTCAYTSASFHCFLKSHQNQVCNSTMESHSFRPLAYWEKTRQGTFMIVSSTTHSW